jgi:gamma-glutamyltranspeptidase/glutathione hydrolase
VRALASAKRAAFAVRDAYVSDPDCMPYTGEELLRRGTVETVAAGAPPVAGDTVYICTVDRHGNACSLIQSIYYAFGSAFVAGDTGVLLHNRAHYFSLGDDGVNVLKPRKRPLHTLMACMAREGGRLRHVFGTMGADGQPQTNVQVLQHLLDGAQPDEAVSAPRVLHGRFVLEDDPDVLHVESSYDADALAALAETEPSLNVVPAGDERFGHAHAITIGDGGDVSVGVDPRSDGRRPETG